MKRILFIIIIAASLQVYSQDELKGKYQPVQQKNSETKEVVPP